jgi:hypothetical protein
MYGSFAPWVQARSRTIEEAVMAEDLDTSKGWCCDGRTWTEHAAEGGGCCQSEGTQMDALPPEGQQAARDRLQQAG